MNLHDTGHTSHLGGAIKVPIPEGHEIITEGEIQEGDLFINGGLVSLKMAGQPEWVPAHPMFYGDPIDTDTNVYARRVPVGD